MANSFTETRDSRNIDKIREIEDELPQVVTDHYLMLTASILQESR